MAKKSKKTDFTTGAPDAPPSFEQRLEKIITAVGGYERAAEICGVSRSTPYLWPKSGGKMPLNASQKLAEAAGVTLDWLATGFAHRGTTGGYPEPSLGTPPPLHAHLLKASIELVEDWLEENDRTMAASAKANIVSKIYQLLVEDSASGSTTVDQTKIKQFLRLVA